MSYEWRHLGSEITVSHEEMINEAWLSRRHDTFSAMHPGWPSLYDSMDPVVGLLLRRIDEFQRHAERMLVEDLYGVEEEP